MAQGASGGESGSLWKGPRELLGVRHGASGDGPRAGSQSSGKPAPSSKSQSQDQGPGVV